MDAVLRRMKFGEPIGTDEREAMALALENLRSSVLETEATEPGAPHSGPSQTEPGPPHSEEFSRTLQARRLRLITLLN